MDTKVLSIFKNDENKARFTAAYDQALTEWPVPYESCFVTTSFGMTHIIKSGDVSKPPLLLIHGMTATSLMWSPNIAEWSAYYYVNCIEVPGDFGKSMLLKQMSSNEAAAEWLQELAAELQLNDFHLLGHSMGGFLALNFAMAYPKRLRSLGLLAPASSFAPLSRMFYFHMIPAVMFPTKYMIDRAFTWCMSPHHNLNLLPMSYRALITASYKNCKPKLGLLPTVYSDEELSQLKVPTLFIVGEDEVIYREAIPDVLAKASRIPDITTATVPRAGHFLSIEQKEEINRLVLDFLAKHPTSPGHT
ncbi:alpha/beta fold hydrolase [Paenibacillus azoreducens]|uniref:Carboxylesterase nap n=1 Tax=Paenibacillus azoreducens TaxID=116718 RepID=A0A919YFT1_9BACL|nr:alpha/beta hydrolase [Paenibacillus azoreducens]GIO50402.1 putative carboxylesterase nap [Paenibacillus azoreducens]